MEHIARLNIEGPGFAMLVSEALEAEYGGEVDNLMKGLSQGTLESPEKFAGELFKTFGTEAMQYFVTIIKYAESGRFQPEEESKSAEEEQELESLVHEIESDPNPGEETDPRAT